MLEDKAKDLGRTIGQSAEYKAVKRSSEALNEDRESSTLLRQMEGIRQEAQAMIDRGEQPTQEMEVQLDGLLEQVQTQSSYQHAVEQAARTTSLISSCWPW
ncbi:MAG: YlbF family regulator, partial [Gemmatimonadaceae bacterium]